VKFIIFATRWIANNLTVPFWMLGHVHLSLNVYDDLVEILASFGMNILVAIGFYLDWKEHKQNK
jgi:hypothetical protein